MPSTNINAELISANVLKYLEDTLGTEYVLGDPSKFDPNAEDKSGWVQVWLSDFRQDVVSGPTTYTGTLTGWACSRSQTLQYEHHRMAKLVQDALHEVSIPLIDYAAGGDPEVGRLTFRYTTMRDAGQVNPNYQKAVLTFVFRVDQY